MAKKTNKIDEQLIEAEPIQFEQEPCKHCEEEHKFDEKHDECHCEEKICEASCEEKIEEPLKEENKKEAPKAKLLRHGVVIFNNGKVINVRFCDGLIVPYFGHFEQKVGEEIDI